MKAKFKLLFSIIIVVIIGALGVLLYYLKTSNSSVYNISVKEYDVTSGENELELTLSEGNVVGVYTSDDEKERGVYVLNKNEQGQVAVTYRSFEDWDEEVSLYISEHVALAYHTYQFEDNVLLLEMFYDESEQLKFELREIIAGIYGESANLVYQDTCERMPYVNIVELLGLENSRYTTSRVLLNYDNNGESKLLLLNEILSEFWVDHNRIVDSGIYFFGQEGTEYIEIGQKICFAGGYGDSIYYQVLYNELRDPHPYLVRFETVGDAVMFEYNVHTEEISRVTEPEKKLLHINANHDYAIFSEYDYYEPLLDSGKIISLKKEGKEYIIPGVESGIDISASRFIDDNKSVFYTPNTLYFFDGNDEVLYTHELEDNTSILLNTEGVYMITANGENVKMQYIDYQDVFYIE